MKAEFEVFADAPHPQTPQIRDFSHQSEQIRSLNYIRLWREGEVFSSWGYPNPSYQDPDWLKGGE